MDFSIQALKDLPRRIHESIRQVPAAGHFYTMVHEHIALPLWNISSKVVHYVAPYFNIACKATSPYFKQYPIISVILATGLVYTVARAVMKR